MTTHEELTARQFEALAALDALPFRQFAVAANLGTSAATLSALATRGLVERRWLNSSLRGGERWGYRLTTRGWAVHRKATKVVEA